MNRKQYISYASGRLPDASTKTDKTHCAPTFKLAAKRPVIPGLLQNLLQPFVALLFLVIASQQNAYGLEALADQEMSAVTGQEGVQISLDYYYNAVKTDAHTFAAAGSGQPTGYGIAACGGGDGYAAALGDMDCRLSWQLANRGDADTLGVNTTTTWDYNNGTSTYPMDGEWLVWKAGWMSLSANGLNLDASFLGEADSSGTSYESWLNPNLAPIYGSFVNSSGTGGSDGSGCLMPDGHGLSPCTVDYIKAMPALKTHYDNGGGSYDSASRTLTGYNDARFGMQIIGLSAEYDDNVGGVPGWRRNEMGSFTSLRIADNNGNQAGVTFGGNFYLYGF